MYDAESAQTFIEALGAEIAHFRRRRGLKRDELANLAGISPSTMGRIERTGPKDVSDTWLIAKALNVPLEDLVRRAEEGRDLTMFDTLAAAHDDPEDRPDDPEE